MFLRSTTRKKDGKDHRYFSVVENRRVSGEDRPADGGVSGRNQRHQQAAWLKTLDVFDEQEQEATHVEFISRRS